MTALPGARSVGSEPVESLPPLRVAGRLEAVLDEVAAAGVDVVVIDAPADVRWLCGFTGSAGRLLVDADRAVLVTDGRYGEQAAAQLAEAGSTAQVEVAGHDAQRRLVDDVLAGRVVGVEAAATSWSAARALAASAAELVALGRPVTVGRRRKDAAELARIRAAARIADAALAEVTDQVRTGGVTEREVARALDRAMEDAGADRSGYPTIVASGPNAALAHATPGSRRLRAGDVVVIDVGAEVDGYRSDMTRTFAVGPDGASDPDAARWDAAVRAAQSAGLDAVGPAATGRDVDRAARLALEDHGYDGAMTHGIGHGVGLVIHEEPMLSRSDDPLEVDMAITVEPGVYLPGRGGVRWEDLVVVTDRGCEVLTLSPKGPLAP